jgi:hypothetical protein
MATEIINLQSVFAMNNTYFIKNISECFAKLNTYLKSKSGAAHDPLWIREDRNNLRLGYVIQNKESNKTYFFSDEIIPNDFGALERACVVQFVIFEACKHYGCYNSVPMCGAPEDGKAYFTFTHEEVDYQYQIWN